MIRTRKANPEPSPAAMALRRRLVDDLVFELVPMKSVAGAIEALPPNARVSVTASPVKRLDATRELSDQIRGLGHRPIPHIAARMVGDRAYAEELARWTKQEGHDHIFVIAGDAEEPHGPYEGGHQFLRDFLQADHGVSTVGIPSYPDGHAFLSAKTCHEQLHAKQQLIDEAGLSGWTSTQMCFDTELVASWLRQERDEGLTLPVHLGLAGVVDRTKLMTMGVRLGVGASLRYLKKNRAALTKLISPGQYDPDEILMPLVEQLEPLGVEALHVFTFNQVDRTDAWRQAVLSDTLPDED